MFELLTPLLGPALNYLSGPAAKAKKPTATTPVQQSAQQTVKPVQSTPIAPPTAIPSPQNNAQGTGQASIPTVRAYQQGTAPTTIPGPPAPFQQDSYQSSPFYKQSYDNWANSKQQIMDLSGQSAAYLASDPSAQNAQLEQMQLDAGRARDMAEAQRARDQFSRDNVNTMQQYTTAQDRLRAAQALENQLMFEKQEKQMRDSAAANNIGFVSGVTDSEVRGAERDMQAKNNTLAAQVQANVADKFAQLEGQRMQAEEAYQNRASQINNNYINARLSIAKDRSSSEQKKQEAMLNLRSKMMDDLRLNDQNFQTNNLNLQKQYSDAYDQSLKVSDMLGYVDGQNTLKRDTLNETARKTDLNYNIDLGKLEATWAKINKARSGSGTGPATPVSMADVQQQLDYWMKPKELGGPGYTYQEAEKLILERYSTKQDPAIAAQLQDYLMGAGTKTQASVGNILGSLPLIGQLFGGSSQTAPVTGAPAYIAADATKQKTIQAKPTATDRLAALRASIH